MDHLSNNIFFSLLTIFLIGHCESATSSSVCGKCIKNDSSCHLISGIFTRKDIPYGYREVTEVPKGACSINITEMYSSRNYIAIKKKSGEYILNGDWNLMVSGSYEGGGTQFDYTNPMSSFIPNEKESLFAKGPLNESIVIMIIKQDSRVGINYEFTIPVNELMKNRSINFVSNKNQDLINSKQKDLKEKPYSIHSKTVSNKEGYAYLGERDVTSYKQIQSDQSIPSYHYNENNYNRNKVVPQSSLNSQQNNYNRNKVIPQSSLNSQPWSNRNSYAYNNVNYSPEHKIRHHRKRRILPMQGFDSPQLLPSRNPQYNALRGSHATYVHNPSNQNPNVPNTVNSNQVPRLLNSNVGYQNTYFNDGNTYQALGARSISNQPSRSFLKTNQIPQSQPLYPPNNQLYSNRNNINSNSFNYNRPQIQNQRNLNSFNSIRQPLSTPPKKTYLETGNSVTKLASEFSWKISGFTECSEKCGGGLQTTLIVCVRGVSQAIVTDENCDEPQKPKEQTVTCNNSPCGPAWHASAWTRCSTSCGAGTQTRNVSCKTRVSALVKIDLLDIECRDRKLPSVQTCNQDTPCVRWKIGEWGKCSVDCGRGQRNRVVVCVNIENKTVAENKCPGDRPESAEVCDMGSCAKTWFYSPWSNECSNTCGESFKTRDVICSSEAKYCSNATRPDNKKRCEDTVPCGGKWFSGPWAECSTSCGKGYIEREVLCMKQFGPSITVVGDENCNVDERPESKKPCENPACIPKWFTADWSECSQSCGGGFRTREIKCLDAILVPNTECPLEERPSIRNTCNKSKCPDGKTGNKSGKNKNLKEFEKGNNQCKDTFENCELVVQSRLCKYNYYQGICCASCKL